MRARVDALVRALGLGDAPAPVGPVDDPAAARQEILERLARHEIDADVAAAAIRDLRKETR